MRAHTARRAFVSVAASAAAVTVPLLLDGGVVAAQSCDAADFTQGNVFDTQGYLACLGGTLSDTGSDFMRTVAVASGLTIVGAGALVASARRNRLPIE